MSYAVRNTFIIAAFWLLLLGGGFFYYQGHQDKVLHHLTSVKAQKQKKLEELKQTQSQLAESYAYYNHLQEINSGKNGIIASQESPGETYDYILREMKRSGLSLEISLTFEKSDSISSVQRRIYRIEGMGKFPDVYKLLWFLEKGPVFYGIQTLELEQTTAEEKKASSVDADTKFALSLESFNRQDGPKLAELVRQNGSPRNIAQLVTVKMPKLASNTQHQPVKRTVTREVRKPRMLNPNGLPVVSSQTKVMAITPISIIIKDANGKLVKLRKGDKVYGGYLREISTIHNQAIFEVNNGHGRNDLILNAISK